MKQLFEITKNNVVNQLGSDRVKIDITEDALEELIFNNPSIVCDNIFFIGRQVLTSTGKRLDLIAIDNKSNIIVIELKKGIAPREIIAQVLDYTSWLHNLSEREIENIIKSHFEKYKLPYKNVSEAFETIFHIPLQNRIGNEIIPVLFADEFPEEIVNSMNYLANYGVPIRCIEFDVFKGINNSYLYTFDIGDHISVEIDSSSNNYIIHENKLLIRKIVGNLTDDLNTKYYDLFDNIKYKSAHKFKTSQNKSGSWTTSFIEWRFANNILVLEVPIWPKTDEEDQGFCIKLWFRKNIDDVSLSKINNIKQEIISKFKFTDEGDSNQFVLVKYYFGIIDDNYIESNSFEIIDILKSYIEQIMELF